jgi:hypothetical protein
MLKPFSLEPMLCQSDERLPKGRQWSHYELELDSYGAIGRKIEASAQLWSRNRKTLPAGFRWCWSTCGKRHLGDI